MQDETDNNVVHLANRQAPTSRPTIKEILMTAESPAEAMKRISQQHPNASDAEIDAAVVEYQAAANKALAEAEALERCHRLMERAGLGPDATLHQAVAHLAAKGDPEALVLLAHLGPDFDGAA